MKALMFGWEFPPHILGGLGTACYGLTKGLSLQKDLQMTFVLPKPQGDEDQSFMKIIGANLVPIVYENPDYGFLCQQLGNKMSADEYYHYRDCICEDNRYITSGGIGTVDFSGRYPDNLLDEIRNYTAVAAVVARAETFDIIHSHDWLTYPAGVRAKQLTGKPLVIHVHAVYYIEQRVHSHVFHTDSGDYEEYGTMGSLDRMLQKHVSLFRVGASYIINLKYVTKVEGNTLTIKSNDIRISRSRKRDLMQKLNDYLAGEGK